VSEESGGKWKIIAGLALLASVMALGGALWFVLSADGERVAAQPEAVPIARAPDGPDRERPADPGGTVVPDQDKQVYKTFQPAAARSGDRVERLLPAEEAPMEDPAPAPAPKAPEAATDTETETAAVTEQQDDVSSELAAEAETAAPQQPAPPPRIPAPPAKVAAKPSVEPKPEPKVALVQPAAGVWQVQFAALRDEPAALATWKRISGKHSSLLGKLSPSVSRIDIKDKGTFYRLRAGSFSSRAEAVAFCDRLKKAGQDCLVAKSQ